VGARVLPLYRLEVSSLVQYSTGADDAPGTYVTFYVVAFVCALLTMVLGLKVAMGCDVPGEQSQWFRMGGVASVLLFVSATVHSFTMGWLHEYYHNWDSSDGPVFANLWDISVITQTLAGTGVFFLSEFSRKVKGFGVQDESTKTIERMLYFVILVVTLVIIVVTRSLDNNKAMDAKALVAYFFSCCMFLFLLAVSVLDIAFNAPPKNGSSRHFATAIILHAIGIGIQFGLDSTCSGHNAFETSGCPLPDAFNHNAFFNVFQMAVYGLIGVGALKLYDEMRPEEESEPTVKAV